MIVKSDIVTARFFSTVGNNQVVYVPDVIHDELTCSIPISAVIPVGIWIFWLMVLFGCCSSLLSLTVRQSALVFLFYLRLCSTCFFLLKTFVLIF